MNFLKLQIDHFLESKSRNPDSWLIHCANQPNLRDAIAFAALAENHLGKRHPHQYRRQKTALEKFAGLLLGQSDGISKAESFHELLNIVGDCKVPDIGSLTFYDTATRIGAYLKIFPEKIYLHTGTRLGAEKLLGRKIKTATLERYELPAVFQNPRISCADIEDILCHMNKVPAEVKNGGGNIVGAKKTIR
ncbi:hypothetical protein J2X69_000017 [Algoriphagus sp. 4150]|uniref:hypothetical protein n=1 Tax=Algoriphagus sp. 4150 TaxID=2817756 RepID=UPI00285FDBB2|nr:hypothetical protein [Algoriphagus sp. 4150]MDR7127689.1 hypothetical protein [Algoriphagus sp. 4150]